MISRELFFHPMFSLDSTPDLLASTKDGQCKSSFEFQESFSIPYPIGHVGIDNQFVLSWIESLFVHQRHAKSPKQQAPSPPLGIIAIITESRSNQA